MSETKLKSIFTNLGRATLRGVRKCPKCGTLNGTRGVICKNKNCDAVFKEIKRKLCDAVKLHTGSTTQVYSVRVRDYRGFVQLPYIISDLDPTLNFINQSAALCFVDTCQRSFDTSILKCHEETAASISSCPHVLAAIKCVTEATPLIVRNSILSSLNVSNELKQELWLLATETAGPLVQRISKNILAVKCQTSPRDPLGYLHFTFVQTRQKDNVEQKFICGCNEQRGSMNSHVKSPSIQEEPKKCIHYYACICAFASDNNLSEEFDFFVRQEKPFTSNNSTDITETSLIEDSVNVSDEIISEFPIFNADFISSNGTCNIEVLTDDGFLDVTNMVVSKLQPESNHITIFQDNLNITDLPDLSDAYDTTAFIDYTELKNLQEQTSVKSKRNKTKKKEIPLPPSEEKAVSLQFLEWLGTVTESINQTMHFVNDGKPEPLKFITPNGFFECLRERISLGFTKKRLPNFTEAEKRPNGTFTKYIWHITNIFHVKQIFETPNVSLEVTRSFVKNKDGTFSVCSLSNLDFDFSNGFVPIRPLELKTFLKVGNTSASQNDPTPFIIEWIPDLLPVTKCGELRIQFEFGHIREISKARHKK